MPPRGSAEEYSPCRLHRADHPDGVTCTTIRRAHTEQNRGGSNIARAPRQPM
ncbi:MAG TPA: hypothetical protein VGR06_16515 [Actinophytocola sp.]|nr:hypothetical protein [Actinophytocola sp.]